MKDTIKTDKRIVRTKHSLKIALVNLLMKKSIEDISIIELTDVAGINRKTFYLHYKEVISVFREIENNLAESLTTVAKTYPGVNGNLENFLYKVFEAIISDQYAIELLRRTPYAEDIINVICKTIINGLIASVSQTDKILFATEYLVHGTVRLFYNQIRRGALRDLALFTNYSAAIIRGGVKELLGK